MSNTPANLNHTPDDPWAELAQDLGVGTEPLKPVHSPPVVPPVPTSTEICQAESPDDFGAGIGNEPDPEIVPPEFADDELDSNLGDELDDKPELTSVGQANPEKTGKRRRRRRRKKKKGGDEATETATVPVHSAPNPVQSRQSVPVDLPEDDEVLLDSPGDESADEDDEELREMTNWDIPSWQELIASLYRPN